jgi:hypothetical protein
MCPLWTTPEPMRCGERGWCHTRRDTVMSPLPPARTAMAEPLKPPIETTMPSA